MGAEPPGRGAGRFRTGSLGSLPSGLSRTAAGYRSKLSVSQRSALGRRGFQRRSGDAPSIRSLPYGRMAGHMGGYWPKPVSKKDAGMATNTAMAAAAPPALRRVIIAATIGNVLEYFDFVIYGFLAVTISQVLFPVADPTVSLLVTFSAFGLAYPVRPLGAIFVGSYTDKHGRKAGLTLSLALMMIGTTLMTLTPSYAAIGITARS
jgi:hypothetical protein